ncbi:hypothetical protein FB451DRAFT_1177382 [Mycena latifolia]|nr:hypothetical protein FB451DRAFT_1177382 [Mycena latifolia]
MPVGFNPTKATADNPSDQRSRLQSATPEPNQTLPGTGKPGATSLKDRVSEIQSSYTSSASEFHDNNSDEIADSAAAIAAGIDVDAMEDRIKSFSESSQLLMNVLDEVQKLHPFIGVAVLAFKAVISLELKRRDNKASVVALQVKMADMMSELVQLRIIKPSHTLSHGETVEAMLSGICASIAKDIENCGNLCDKYSKTSFYGKLFKSPLYSERFGNFIQTFEMWKCELDHKLALFTAITGHYVTERLAQIQATVESNAKHIRILLQRLQTPLEQKILKAIEQRGSPEACISDDKFIEELIAMVPWRKGSDNIPTAFAGVQNDQTKPTAPYQAFNGGLAVPPGAYRPPGTPHLSTAFLHPAAPVQYPTAPRGEAPIIDSISPNFHSPNFQGYHHQSPNVVPMTYLMPTASGAGSRNPSFDQMQPVSRRSSFGGPAGFPRSSSPMPTIIPSSPNSHIKPFFPPDGTPIIPRSRSMTSQSDDMAPGGRQRSQIIASTIAVLKEEVNEDMETGLKRNMETFVRKLHEQQRQLEAKLEYTVIRQGDRVVAALREGPHDRVQDEEIRALWKEMSWKLSVPAREFVLNLHDYYKAQYSETTDIEDYFNRAPPDGSDQRIALRKALSLAKARTEAKWALKLLTFQNIPKILEAFDRDASGFVSVWEVNELTSARPEGWRFPSYDLGVSIENMWHPAAHAQLGAGTPKKRTKSEGNESILSANRFAVHEYLDGIGNLDLVLASIYPCAESMDANLAGLASVYVKAEEDRLEGILGMLDYEIDSPDTIALIIGRHQIERNLFPVLYILLKYHLKIFHKAREVVLRRHELTSALKSVMNILDSLYFRMANIEISHLLQYNDLFSIFSKFGFGMYSRLRFGPRLHLQDLNDLWSDEVIEYGASYEDPNAPCVNPYTTTAVITQRATGIHSQSGVCGYWTGHFRDHSNKIAPYGMIELFLDSDLKGHGSYCAGILHVSGKEDPRGEISLTIDGSPDDPSADSSLQFSITFQGQMETADGDPRISGAWKHSTGSESAGTLILRRVPAWVYQLTEPYWERPSTRPPGTLWKLALSAVRYQIRRGAELVRYQYLLGDLDTEDYEEFQTFLWKSTPWDARVYRCAARRSIDWTLHTNAFCQLCGRPVITGTRHFCIECGADFCADCPGHHSNIAHHTGDHHIIRLHQYANTRHFTWLHHSAVDIVGRSGAPLGVVVHAVSPSHAQKTDPGVLTEVSKEEFLKVDPGPVQSRTQRSVNSAMLEGQGNRTKRNRQII